MPGRIAARALDDGELWLDVYQRQDAADTPTPARAFASMAGRELGFGPTDTTDTSFYFRGSPVDGHAGISTHFNDGKRRGAIDGGSGSWGIFAY